MSNDTSDSEHPFRLLERAALEFSKATASARVADIRAERYIGGRGARANVLAARARAKALASAQLLEHAAILFAAWATRPVSSGPLPAERIPKHLAHELLDAYERTGSASRATALLQPQVTDGDTGSGGGFRTLLHDHSDATDPRVLDEEGEA